MARLRRLLAVPSWYTASTRSMSSGVRRDGSDAYFHCGGAGAAASNPGRSAPRNTRNRRNERTATAGSLRPAFWRLAASWPTKVVICAAVSDGQSGGATPKQAVMKRLTRCA